MLSSGQPRRVLNVFVLAMLNVSIMLSLRSLPLIAEFGLSSLLYFLIVAVFFLVPSALVSAELATGWPKSGGVYVWVREALGDRWGFFSIWMQWVHNVAWFPVILSFVATTFAYVAAPHLIDNKIYVVSVILFTFWGMTLLNYLGIKISSWFSTVGVIGGTILPGLFIIALGITWISKGNPLQISLRAETVIPHLTDINNLVFLAGLFLAFTGLEASASLAGEVKNPQKNYPRAIVLASLIAFVLLALGAISIAIILPERSISLVAGLMEAFEKFLPHYQLEWLVPILGILLIVGAIAETNSWIISPIKGLYATSKHGNLPPFFQNLNKHGTPTHLLLLQAIIVTVVTFVFFFMPTISSGFWILTALSAQSYLMMYIFMFVAAIRLRYSKPHVPRVYKIPYPHKGIWVSASMGILACLFSIGIGFIPPSQIQIGSFLFYESFLIIGLFIMCVIPLIIYQLRKPHWVVRAMSEEKPSHESPPG